jgi:hypothetical protein
VGALHGPPSMECRAEESALPTNVRGTAGAHGGLFRLQVVGQSGPILAPAKAGPPRKMSTRILKVLQAICLDNEFVVVQRKTAG